MTLVWSDLWFAVSITAVLAFFLGWCVCWSIAMHYGEREGAARTDAEWRRRSPKLQVAMTTLPPGVSAAQLVSKPATREETEEILETWSSHLVINESGR
jgi:hypothetical protein